MIIANAFSDKQEFSKSQFQVPRVSWRPMRRCSSNRSAAKIDQNPIGRLSFCCSIERNSSHIAKMVDCSIFPNMQFFTNVGGGGRFQHVMLVLQPRQPLCGERAGCPFSVARSGRRCGTRLFWIRPGNYKEGARGSGRCHHCGGSGPVGNENTGESTGELGNANG